MGGPPPIGPNWWRCFWRYKLRCLSPQQDLLSKPRIVSRNSWKSWMNAASFTSKAFTRLECCCIIDRLWPLFVCFCGFCIWVLLRPGHQKCRKEPVLRAETSEHPRRRFPGRGLFICLGTPTKLINGLTKWQRSAEICWDLLRSADHRIVASHNTPVIVSFLLGVYAESHQNQGHIQTLKVSRLLVLKSQMISSNHPPTTEPFRILHAPSSSALRHASRTKLRPM